MIRKLLIMLLMTVSFYSYSACYEHTHDHFSVSFSFTNTASTKDLFYFHSHGNGKNKTKYTIWSNQDFPLIDGAHYDVVVTYIAKSKDYGTLYIYLKQQGGEWQLIDENDEYYVKQGAITVDSDTVSLVCEEDVLDPPGAKKPYELSEYCDYFDHSVQSHSAMGSIKIDGNAFVLGEKQQFKLGFSSINDGSGLSDKSCRTGGDAWKCELDPSLIVNPISLPAFPSGGESLSFYDQKVHDVSPGKYESIAAGSSAKIVLSEGVYWVRNLTLNSASQLEIRKGDRVKIYVEKLETNVTSSVNHEGEPDDFLLIGVGENASIHLTGKTTFNGLVYSENRVNLNSNFDYSDDVSLMSATITGAVTAKHLEMNSSSNVRGNSACLSPPVQNYQLRVTPPSAHSLVCESQPVEFQVTTETESSATDYSGQVIVKARAGFPPGKAYWHLSETGGEGSKRDISKENAFDVDSEGKVKLWLKSDYVGTIEVIGKLSTDNSKQAVGNYQFVPFKLEIQRSELKTVAGKPRDISIVAKACSDDSGDDSIANGYIGTRTLKLATEYSAPKTGKNLVYLKDKNGQWQSEEGQFTFETKTNRDGSKTARASSALKYTDAGRTKLTFYDPNCTKQSCDIEPVARLMKADKTFWAGWERLEGVQAVATRPYTFALCNSGTTNIENASGTSGSGNGFVAAGEAFGVNVKPVVWVEGDGSGAIDANQNANAPVDSSAMCSRQETENFYADGAPAATVELSIPVGKNIKPHSPIKDGAVSGKLTSSALSNKQIKNTAFSASWSEVGSVWLQADTQANYLGMDVNMGRRPVGRFYPAYVELQSGNTFAYPGGQHGFAYLGQEFTAGFSVLPKSETGQTVKNYAHFKEGLQVKLGLEAVDGSNNSFGSRLSPQGLWRDWASTTTSMTWKLDRRGQGTGTTTVEPPWRSGNSQWGLYITKDQGNNDPTAIRSASGANVAVEGSSATLEMAPFAVTPELRYGRMRLEDVTVPVSQDAEVPAMVEYYLNSQEGFVLNRDDDASLFGSRHGCSELIFPNAMHSKLAATPTSVAVNDSEGILRVNHPPLWDGTNGVMQGYREQVRLGQQLASATPTCTSGSAATSSQPWLQFNWSGEGDTDPSAIVTFGVYRGNDRIIYRGEKGVNHLLN